MLGEHPADAEVGGHDRVHTTAPAGELTVPVDPAFFQAMIRYVWLAAVGVSRRQTWTGTCMSPAAGVVTTPTRPKSVEPS